MLDLTTGYSTDCEGQTRREFIKVGFLGVVGLTLADFLRLKAMAADPAKKDVKCILLWMHGGPSHIDTFDPKPEAPPEIKGEFGVIKGVTGEIISEHLPKLAQQMDKFSIIRSMGHPDNGHESATHYLLSGYKFNPALEYPSYGSVVGRERGFQGGMPPYVIMGGLPFGYGGAGYMGAVYNPFQIVGDPNAPNFSVRDVTPPAGIDLTRVERRKKMLDMVDQYQRKTEAAAKSIQTMDKFFERAFDLITSPVAKKAFNLNEEKPEVRDLYGRNSFGQSCLLARRLIEAGVHFVTISMGGYDTHVNNFISLKGSLLPRLDQGYAALLQDLHQRGLLDSTLVIWMGEFGRTPRVNGSAGRDHWAQSTAVCMGGGPIKRGIVYGKSNERAEYPAEKEVRPEDIAATIYRALGIDYEKEYVDPQNRPIKINYDGKPVEELFV